MEKQAQALHVVDISSFKESGPILERLLPLANANLVQYVSEMLKNMGGSLAYQATGCAMKNGVFAQSTIGSGVQVALFGGKLVSYCKSRSVCDAYLINIGKMIIPRSENEGKVLRLTAFVDGSEMLNRPGLNGAGFNHSCSNANCVMTSGVLVQVWSYEVYRQVLVVLVWV